MSSQDDEQMMQAQQSEEHELFNELQTLGVLNEHNNNGTRNVRHWQNNQPKKYEPSRNIANSSGEKAPPF
jgi:hypothetical protein